MIPSSRRSNRKSDTTYPTRPDGIVSTVGGLESVHTYVRLIFKLPVFDSMNKVSFNINCSVSVNEDSFHRSYLV